MGDVKPQGYECDCPCGGVMLRKTVTIDGSTYPVAIECPRCGKTPLDLLAKRTVYPDANGRRPNDGD